MRGEADRLPWFKFWPKEFLTDQLVCSAPLEVVGAYAMLLSHAWIAGGRTGVCALPDDDRLLKRMIYFEEPYECAECAQGETWERVKGLLFGDLNSGAPFIRHSDGGWHCPWLSAEFAGRTAENARKASAGREGGLRSPVQPLLKQKRSSEPPAQQESAQAILDVDVDTENTPPTPSRTQRSDRVRGYAAFDLFWQLYPRKENRKRAIEAWKKQRCEKRTDEILAALRKRIELDWQFAEPDKIPHPTTWLNGQRWEDEITPRGRGPGPPSAPGRTTEGFRINAECPRCRAVFFEDEGHTCPTEATA
jgi:hypothetical protein